MCICVLLLYIYIILYQGIVEEQSDGMVDPVQIYLK